MSLKIFATQPYHVHAKDYSSRHARSLAKSVQVWFDDPHAPERQAGWVTQAPTAYVRPVRRIAVRCRQQDGEWAVGVLISNVAAADVLELTGQSPSQLADAQAVLWASVAFYDQRGGGIETSLKGDRQGLGLTRRNKKRFEAQQMLMLLGSLTHNTIVWARRWLAAPQLRSYGVLRLVRDIFHMSGFLGVDVQGHIVQIGRGSCGAPGFCPGRLVAGAARSCSHGRSVGQTSPCSKHYGR